jgi:heme ABC exporter ATP-binding subunit CcmA
MLHFMPAKSANSIVVTRGLIKQFGTFAALRGITTEFAAGKIYVIVGDNGAGKTTLLRIVAGLSQPTRGELLVLGSSRIKDVRSRLGYMAHPSLLYDEMSGIENLRYFAGLYGIAEARCGEAISAVNLDPDLDRHVGQYSQGMKQRLSLARALLHDPQLLLLDEPFSNVDSRSAQQMIELLGNLRERGKTAFLVTHQPSLLAKCADEFVRMEAGLIVERTASRQASL